MSLAGVQGLERLWIPAKSNGGNDDGGVSRFVVTRFRPHQVGAGLGMTTEELADYLTRAATRGGITEAILDGIKTGKNLEASLEDGITRSIHLGRPVTTDQAEPTAFQQLRKTYDNHHDD